jgi:PAS domain S-box-containing protein
MVDRKVMNPVRSVAAGLGLTALYVLAGKLGLSFASVHPNATAVWPPTGIALAAFLLFGARVWPFILLGAFLVNVTTSGTWVTSLGIAAGNTLEGWIGAALVRRFAGGVRAFDRAGGIFRFTLLAGLLGTAVSATIGATSLVLGGLAPASRFWTIWLTWWMGDAAGALTLCPILVLASVNDRIEWDARRALEAMALIVAVFAVGAVVFGGALLPDPNYPLEFACVPPLIWAAFRFGRREAAAVVIAFSAIAISDTRLGSGPFARADLGESLLLLQAFMAILSVTGLAVAATVFQRRRADAELRALNDDLERRVAERTGQLRDANQELCLEIENRARIDETLKRSEARLIEAQRLAHIGSWEWDVSADTIWWSDEMHRIYGLEADRSLDYQGFMGAVHPQDQERVDRVVREAFRDGNPFTFEHRIVRPDGDVRTLYAEGQVVRDENGKVIRMLGIGQDVTEHRRAEEQRAHLLREQSARREAEEANRRKDQFLAMLSHELRTPLSAISGWSQVLLANRALDAEGTRRAIEAIERNARVQERLIADILDISRLDSGKLDLHRTPLSLATVIGGALDTVRPQAASKRITLDERLDGGPGKVLGDPDRLQQVIWNVLANAVKFSHEGGRVETTLERAGDRVRVQVIDEGPGIDPEFLPFLFEAFRQDDSTTTRHHGGLGLGLAIARRILELHGGSISAANRMDRTGAVFTIVLPMITDSEAPEAARVPTPPRAADLRGLRVLVVDDEPDARDVLAAALSHFGAQVVACRSAAEGMEALHRAPFDVLVSDIGMPGEDGHRFIARVRSDERDSVARIPAVALTAYATAEDQRRAMEAGFQMHLSKPIDTDQIARVLARLGSRPGQRGAGALFGNATD